MKFEKDAIQAGRSNVMVCLVMIACLAALQKFFFSRPEMPVILPIGFWLIGGLVALVFGGIGIALLRSGGKWEITIDGTGIKWCSPNESVDKSFDLTFDEVCRSETRVTRSSKGRTNRRYVLITHSGAEIKLSPNSGINLVQVITEMERFGVENLVVGKS